MKVSVPVPFSFPAIIVVMNYDCYYYSYYVETVECVDALPKWACRYYVFKVFCAPASPHSEYVRLKCPKSCGLVW